MKSEKAVYDEMVQNGVMDPSEVPFDEDENKDPTEDNEFQLPYTVTLLHPFQFGKDRITELIFTDYPTAAVCTHLPAIDASQYKMGHFVGIIAHCCGVSNALVKAMRYPDFNRCFRIVVDFLLVSGE